MAHHLDFDDARHLLLRTGWGPEPGHIDGLVGKTRRQAVRSLLVAIRTEPQSPLPSWYGELPPPRREIRANKRVFKQRVRRMAKELRTWWLAEMVTTPSPLTEKLTLFWHGHFTSSLRVVRWAPAMLNQNLLFRRHAAGSFRDLLTGVLRDPAMLRYLDNHQNRVGKPNENLARELLELFTLGEGHYSEADIKELARALTGAGIQRRAAGYRFAPRRHDHGVKTILGKSGRFAPGDIPALLLGQRRVAEHIVERLWLFFVSDRPEPAVIEAIAQRFRRSWSIRETLEALLLTDAFWNPTNRGSRCKSPVELVAGAARAFYLPDDRIPALTRTLRALGQDLFAPPSVKGWPIGDRWLTAQRLLLRRQFLATVAAAAPAAEAFDDIAATWVGKPGASLPDVLQRAEDVILACPPVRALPRHGARPFAAALAHEPAMQLT